MSEYSSLAAVERTFQVIEILVGEVNGISVTELVDKTKLPKSIVSRILTTLHQSGYVERDSKTRYYKLSFQFMSMTYRHINALGLDEIFYPMMEKASIRTGELIQLAVVKDDGIFFIAKIEGNNSLKIASMLGKRAPYHATAAGKVWLASLPMKEVYNIIGKYGLKQYTDKTIIDIEVLMKELEEIKHKGYAIANEEINQEVTAIAVPIYDYHQKERVIALLVIAAPRYIMTPERIELLRGICMEEITKFDASLLSSFSIGRIQKH